MDYIEARYLVDRKYVLYVLKFSELEIIIDKENEVNWHLRQYGPRDCTLEAKIDQTSLVKITFE